MVNVGIVDLCIKIITNYTSNNDYYNDNKNKSLIEHFSDVTKWNFDEEEIIAKQTAIDEMQKKIDTMKQELLDTKKESIVKYIASDSDMLKDMSASQKELLTEAVKAHTPKRPIFL